MTTTNPQYLTNADIIYTNNKMYNPVTKNNILHTNKNYNSVLIQIEKYNTKHNLTPSTPPTPPPPTNRTETIFMNHTPAPAPAPTASGCVNDEVVTPTPTTTTTTENLINDTQTTLNTALHPHLPNLTTDPVPTTSPPPTHNYIYNYEVNCMDGFKYVKEKVINCRFAKDKYSIGDIGLMDELREARKDNMTTLYKFYKDGEEEPLHDRLGISQHKENIFFALPYEITAPQPFRSGYYKFVGKEDMNDRVCKYTYHITRVTKFFVTLRYKYIYGDVWKDDAKFKIRYDDAYNTDRTKIYGWYILLQGCGFTGCDNWRVYFSDLEEE